MVTKIVAAHQLKVTIPNNPLEKPIFYLIQGDKNYTLIDTGWDSNTAFNSITVSWPKSGVCA